MDYFGSKSPKIAKRRGIRLTPFASSDLGLVLIQIKMFDDMEFTKAIGFLIFIFKFGPGIKNVNYRHHLFFAFLLFM